MPGPREEAFHGPPCTLQEGAQSTSVRPPETRSPQAALLAPGEPVSSCGSVLPSELSEQIQRALQLEEERKRAQEEAERLEADRMAALRAKEELERQAVDQIKSQEQLVGPQAARC